jgi:hypothetical protein
LWAPFPPPIGGVTMSACAIRDWLDKYGSLQGVVDLSSPRGTIAHALRRPTSRHLFWCSVPESIPRFALLAQAARGPTILFVHGGTTAKSTGLKRWHLRFDRVFATNQLLADHLQTLTAVPVELASAHVPTEMGRPRSSSAESRRCIIAVGGLLSWYGLDVALRAVEIARSAGLDFSLTIAKYGEPTPLPSLPPWATLVQNTSPDDTTELLSAHSVLLRPGTVDGDSLLVRQALDLGLRVVASDSVPRPAGVELCRSDPHELANCLRNGGPPSNGAGLGPPITELLDRQCDQTPSRSVP